MGPADDDRSVSYSVDDGVAQVRLQRPEVMNALSPTLVADLQLALDRAADDGVGALVLSGEGRGFCAGADMERVAALISADSHDGAMWAFNAAANRVVVSLHTAPFVTVAAVDGPVAGAGIGLALAVDFRVFGRSARVVPRFAALGVTPDNGSSYFMTQLLGPAKARQFFLRDESLPADEALSLGIADEVVEDGQTVAAATDLARRYRATARNSVTGIRALTDRALEHDLRAQLDMEASWASGGWPAFRAQAEAFLAKSSGDDGAGEVMT
jgi:2-(1,2-epoxy-1,2-dihydrophenyl)acetyl-CoA isomerase